MFSLFPAVIGHYYGDLAFGSNYGLLYTVAKCSGGIYGGVLSAVLINDYGFPVAIGTAGVMAIVAGLLVIPLKANPQKPAASAGPATARGVA